jgi:hypothetical protein
VWEVCRKLEQRCRILAMATGTLPRPGTKYGPCEPSCSHTDCAATRRMAETVCTFGDGPIGYDRAFYQTDSGLAHAYCEEGSALGESKGQRVRRHADRGTKQGLQFSVE